jgi:hypothetical protein
MHPGARRVAIHELPKLPTRGKKRAAGATYHAGIVFFRIGINDGWGAAAGAREFIRHLISLSSFNLMPTRTPRSSIGLCRIDTGQAIYTQAA